MIRVFVFKNIQVQLTKTDTKETFKDIHTALESSNSLSEITDAQNPWKAYFQGALLWVLPFLRK